MAKDSAERLAELARPHMKSDRFRYDQASREDVIRLAMLATLGGRDLTDDHAARDAVERLLGEPGG